MSTENARRLEAQVVRRQAGMSRRTFLERTALLGAGGTAALALLSACGGGGTSTNTNNPVTLQLWDYYNPKPAYSKLLDDFMKANPSIKIQRTYIPFADLKQKILQGSAAGQLPDIIVIDNPDHSSMASKGVLADITSRVQSWGQSNQYFPGPLKSATWQNKIYGIPHVSNCLAIYYNKDLFDAAKLSPPTTWDELRSTAKALTKNGVYGFSMSLIKTEEGTFQFLPFLWQAGADLDRLDSPEATKALQFLVDLLNDGSMSKEVITYTQQDSITQFIGQKAAMSMNGPWQIPGIKQGASFKWAVAPLPKGQQSVTILGGENWAIPQTSQHIDEVWTFLKWVEQPDHLKPFLVADGDLPSRKDVAQANEWQNDPYLSVFVNQFPNARPRAYGPNYPQISSAVQDAFQSALSGQSSAADALKKAANIVKPLLS